jgi:hypothetical protein
VPTRRDDEAVRGILDAETHNLGSMIENIVWKEVKT